MSTFGLVAKDPIFTFLFFTVLVPLAVYGLARVVFAAYFAAKAAFLRRFFRNERDQIPPE